MPGLATPFPLVGALPGLLQDDAFVQRLCAGLDEVLAPVVTTLDGLPAYLDPDTTPLDVLTWLAGWAGVLLDSSTPPERRRALVRSAPGLHRRRGTASGVRDAVAAWFGIEPEVTESGGATWSTEPGASFPGDREPYLLVRLRVADASTIDVRRLEAVVAGTKPAHVPHRVEVVGGSEDERDGGSMDPAQPTV